MSFASWNKEYYSVPAKALKHEPLEAAIDHCIHKWVGLRPTNLTRHQLKAAGYGDVKSITSGAAHTIADASRCALCIKFYKQGCAGCPINNGDDHTEGCYNQWRAFADDGNPEKMIRVLRAAKKKLQTASPNPTAAAMEQAAKVLEEISTAGGRYGYIQGALVYDATQAAAALRKVM